ARARLAPRRRGGHRRQGPLHHERAGRRAIRDHATSGGGFSMKRPGRVLVVDDEEFYRAMLAEELTQDGWIVEAVASRGEALDALAREAWSVVLVDQKLRGPGGPDSGLDLIAEIRRAQPEARPIVITAYASPEAVDRAYRDGAYDFIEKTESFTALLRIKVRNAMEGIRTQWLELTRSGAASSTLAGLLADA